MLAAPRGLISPIHHPPSIARFSTVAARYSPQKANSHAVVRQRASKRRDKETSVSESAVEQLTDAGLKVEKSGLNTSTPAQTKGSSQRTLLKPSSDNHHDLASFLARAARTKLSTASSVYRGTHYEYTVAGALSRFDIQVTRRGGRSDLGVDLVGHWTLPSLPNSHPLRVLVQCKARSEKLSPNIVRELEGAFVGAPAGWRGEGVLGLLATPSAATKGAREAMGRSEYPMGFLKIGLDGKVEQFLWNKRASEMGLCGMGVTLKYSDEEEANSAIILTWKGKAIQHDHAKVESRKG